MYPNHVPDQGFIGNSGVEESKKNLIRKLLAGGGPNRPRSFGAPGRRGAPGGFMGALRGGGRGGFRGLDASFGGPISGGAITSGLAEALMNPTQPSVVSNPFLQGRGQGPSQPAQPPWNVVPSQSIGTMAGYGGAPEWFDLLPFLPASNRNNQYF